MSWSKRQFVEAAFAEIGYASYVYDLQPEQLDLALRRMDTMMATWNGKGIRVGYPIPISPENSSLDEETNVPDSANEAIITNLAVRIAPSIGKSIPTETRATARAGYVVLLQRASLPPEQQFPSMFPAGAGNKPWRNDTAFLDPPTDALLVGRDSPLEL